jgi:hypothetical protein
MAEYYVLLNVFIVYMILQEKLEDSKEGNQQP